MGVGEGVAFPAIHAIIARSVPVDKQSTAVGIVTAASYGGTAPSNVRAQAKRWISKLGKEAAKGG